jgi:hypothetical protein
MANLQSENQHTQNPETVNSTYKSEETQAGGDIPHFDGLVSGTGDEVWAALLALLHLQQTRKRMKFNKSMRRYSHPSPLLR